MQLFFPSLKLLLPSHFSRGQTWSSSRTILLAFTIGAIGGLAHQPLGFFPLLACSFMGILWLLEPKRSPKETLGIGWAFGFGYNVMGLYWLSIAFINGGLPLLFPVGLVAVPSFVACFIALALGGVVKLSRTPLERAIAFTFFWSLYEWVLGNYLFNGFPWNLTGYIWGLSVLQITSVIGIYGLSFLTTFAAVVFFTRDRRLIISSFVLFIGLFLGGEYRLHQAGPTEFTSVKMRLVQPSVPQQEKWDPMYMRRNLSAHLSLSNDEKAHGLHAVIWPEAAVPFYLGENQKSSDLIISHLPQGATLLAGSPRRLIKNSIPTIFSSLMALSPEGKIIGYYDKSHLVPFGEYFPFRKWFDIPKITSGSIDYTPGKGPETFRLSSLPAASFLICYEAIFSGEVVDRSNPPEWILNITNDGWYGDSTGPFQHFFNVRVRAIEEGIPLVRAANNGISATIDGYGRIISTLKLNEVNYLDFNLPKKSKRQTLFFIVNHWIFAVFMFLISIILLKINLRAIRNNYESKRKKAESSFKNNGTQGAPE